MTEELKISQRTDNLSFSQKTGYAFYTGGLLGLLAGVGRVFWFFYSENYSRFEIQSFALNYFQSSINQFFLFGLVAGLLLALIWFFFSRLEGFIVAGIIVILPILPVAYFLNKSIFPGRMHPVSLIGNGVIALAVLGMTLWLFFRQFRKISFIPALYRNWLVVAISGFVVLINALYFFQPLEWKLTAVSSEPGKLLTVLKTDIFSKSNFSASPQNKLHQHFSGSLEKHLRLLHKKVALRDSLEIIIAAERVLSREFEFLNIQKKLPVKINWQHNPTGDREWLLALNRMDWLWELAAAFEFTKNSKYARAFDQIMREWFEQNPVLRWKNENHNVWRLIESSARVTDSWIEAFAVFYSSEDVSDEVKLRMLASFHDHAQFLAHFRSPRRNHLLQETFGLLAVAAAFPEFKMSGVWLDIAGKRLDFAMHSDVYPDGGYTEGSIYYHRFAIRILQQVLDCAEHYGIKLSDYFYQQLERMYSFLMNTSRPDGIMSAMNDGFHAKNQRVLFDRPAEVFNREDFAYFASRGQKGKASAVTSTYYPYSGVAIQRSDWGGQARFTIFDGGLFGSSHGHEDKLNFELFAYGKPFIVESGTFTYVINRWRKYFTSSFAHNTILVDGKSQMRHRLDQQWVNSPPVELPNIWISNEHLDYIESTYSDGYGNIKENILNGITHTRRLIFVKPYYWVLWDVVAGAGQHRTEQLLHFAAETNVVLENGQDIHATYTEGANLLIKTLLPERGNILLVSGEEKPVQGWVSPKYGVKNAAPVAITSVNNKLPIIYVQVLVPGPDLVEFTSHQFPVTLKDVELSADRAIMVTTRTADWSDTLLLAPQVVGLKKSAGVSTEAQILFHRASAGSDSVLIQIGTISPALK